MSDYLNPVADEPDLFVSASWQDHKDRTPPSGEPGTDYACSTGTVVRAPGDGEVVDRKTSNSGAMGRYVTLALDDGRTTRTLHMQRVDVPLGSRVRRGDALGISGASGNGSDYYYGPHAHQTLWDGPAWVDPTIDFEEYVGDVPAPPIPTPPEEDDMQYGLIHCDRGDGMTRRGFYAPGTGYFVKWDANDPALANDLAETFETGSSIPVNKTMFEVFEEAAAAVRGAKG